MTYRELARIYLDEGGLGEATVLFYFDYRPGKGPDDLVSELILGSMVCLGASSLEQENRIARRLARVLISKNPPRSSRRVELVAQSLKDENGNPG